MTRLVRRACSGRGELLHLDWIFTRSLQGPQIWDEFFTVLNLNYWHSKNAWWIEGLSPSEPLARLDSSEPTSSDFDILRIEFNPVHPVVVVLYDDDSRRPALSAYIFSPHSHRLDNLLLQKKFDHHGYISASWSPNGTFLLVQSVCYDETLLVLFYYDAKRMALSERPGWQHVSKAGSHSPHLWKSGHSFLSYPMRHCTALPATEPWIHTIRKKGFRFDLKRKTGAQNSRSDFPSRGFLKALNSRFSCETSHCIDRDRKAHSTVHLMNEQLIDASNVHLPGLLIDVAGKDDKVYILWRTRVDVGWNSSKPTISDPTQKCSLQPRWCILGSSRKKSKGADCRIELTVIDLQTLREDERSTCIEPCYRASYVFERSAVESSEYNIALCKSQPKLSFTEHLLIIDGEDWQAYECTCIMHLRHKLEKEPLRMRGKAFLHPKKNAHVTHQGGGFPVALHSEKMRLPDFPSPLHRRTREPNGPYSLKIHRSIRAGENDHADDDDDDDDDETDNDW